MGRHLQSALCLAVAVVVSLLASCAGNGNASNVTTPVAESSASDPTVVQRSLSFQGATYPYFVFKPEACTRSICPAVLLAHGSGGDGLSFLEIWKDFAGQNDIVLIAPTLPLGDSQSTANTEAIVPQLFPAIVDAAQREWVIDPKRIYLFGYSAGGYTVYDAAMLDSTYFAGAAVFAAVITPDYTWIVQSAQRKIPVAIYIGDNDQYFSLAEGQQTCDLLQSNGFTVHYVEIPNQDHNYSTASASVNSDAWTFMSQYALP